MFSIAKPPTKNARTGTPRDFGVSHAAARAITSTGTATLPVEISNDGVVFASPGPVSGNEAADNTNASLIELNLDLLLNDDDGSEEILTVLLSNLPQEPLPLYALRPLPI